MIARVQKAPPTVQVSWVLRAGERRVLLKASAKEALGTA
nr:MAG TPA_asm: hypothetical protein [Caudoviricetes sp.]